jgi:hypothetical protein
MSTGRLLRSPILSGSPQGGAVLKRIVITCTALAVLVGGAAALAAASYNSYKGTSFSFSPKKAGSAQSPSPLGFEEILNASGPGGTRAAPLTDIKTWYYGLVAGPNKFATCSDAKIISAKNDTVCPPKALVASGQVNSLLGPADLSNQSGVTHCNPKLDVWNGGGGKLIFFFVTTTTAGSKYYCANLPTGATAPYDGHVSQKGKYLFTDVPLPKSISTNVAGLGLYGSLIHEDLVFKNLTTKVKGKTVGFQQSVGCLKGKRPWKVQYTALANGQSQSSTVTGSVKC